MLADAAVLAEFGRTVGARCDLAVAAGADFRFDFAQGRLVGNGFAAFGFTAGFGGTLGGEDTVLEEDQVDWIVDWEGNPP